MENFIFCAVKDISIFFKNFQEYIKDMYLYMQIINASEDDIVKRQLCM